MTTCTLEIPPTSRDEGAFPSTRKSDQSRTGNAQLRQTTPRQPRSKRNAVHPRELQYETFAVARVPLCHCSCTARHAEVDFPSDHSPILQWGVESRKDALFLHFILLNDDVSFVFLYLDLRQGTVSLRARCSMLALPVFCVFFCGHCPMFRHVCCVFQQRIRFARKPSWSMWLLQWAG